MHATRKKKLKRIAYSAAEVAEMTSLGRRIIAKMIADGTLRTVKVGARRLIYASSVEALLPDDAA